MKFCANCGQRMPDEDIFCSNCGAKISEETVQSRPKNSVVPVASVPRKPVNVAPQKQVRENKPTPKGDLTTAQNILFQTVPLPDYAKALAYIARAQKMGASAVETHYLNLAVQLYRTLDMLRGSLQIEYVDGKQMNILGNSIPTGTPSYGKEASTQTKGGQENPSKAAGKPSTSDLLKSATVGAITGAVAQAITKNVLGQNNTTVSYQGQRTVRDSVEPVAYYENDPTIDAYGNDGLMDGQVEELSAIPAVEAAEIAADDGYDGLAGPNDFATSDTLIGGQDLDSDDTADESTDDVIVDTDDDDFDSDSDDSSIFDDLF